MNASCGSSTLPTAFMRFLPSFCFSRSFALACDVAAVAFCEDILAAGAHVLARDDFAPDRCLDGDLEHLLGDDFLQLGRELAAACGGTVAVDDGRKSVHGVAVEEDVELDKIAGLVVDQLVVEGGVRAWRISDGRSSRRGSRSAGCDR